MLSNFYMKELENLSITIQFQIAEIEFINCMYARDKLYCHPKTNSNAKNAGWYLALKKSFSGMLTMNMLGQHNRV